MRVQPFPIQINAYEEKGESLFETLRSFAITRHNL